MSLDDKRHTPSLAKRISTKRPSYALGRFLLVRRGYSQVMHARHPPHGLVHREIGPMGDLDAARITADLKADAFALLPSLPPEVTADIRQYASDARLAFHGRSGRDFRYGDIRQGRVHGQPVVLADVLDPTNCEGVAAVLADGRLRHAAATYLRYEPRRVTPWLFWSIAAQYSVEERRRAGQTFEYHYDVHGYNFVYANFYLTDVDEGTGVHRIARASHRRKPLRRLFNSAIATDDEVSRIYGADALVAMTGPAGTAFIEDTSCYHLASPPVAGDRLMLQLRYS